MEAAQIETKRKKKRKDHSPYVEPDSEATEIETKKMKKRKHHISEIETQLESETQFETKEKERESVQATIQVIQGHQDKTAPLVGYFSSRFDPQKNDASVRVFRKKDKRFELVVSPNGSNVDFVGSSHPEEAETGQSCSHYCLGVLDKETRMLKIVPIASEKIFRLVPRVRSLDKSENEPSSLSKEEVPKDMAIRRRVLTESFGTNKSMARDKKSEILKQKEDPQFQEVMDQKIQAVPINKEALKSATAPSAGRNIPPHDTSATTVEEAYPLDKIILNHDWKHLYDIYELVDDGKEVSSESYPTFVCNRIQKYKEIEDQAEKEKIACILSYITHLIKFKDQNSMDGHKLAKYHKFPSFIRQKLVLMFCDAESNRLSVEKNALLISYVLVLTLFCDGFRSDFSDIAKDLRLNSSELRSHYGNLGCKIVRENKSSLATLSVPLEFPKLGQRRRR